MQPITLIFLRTHKGCPSIFEEWYPSVSPSFVEAPFNVRAVIPARIFRQRPVELWEQWVKSIVSSHVARMDADIIGLVQSVDPSYRVGGTDEQA